MVNTVFSSTPWDPPEPDTARGSPGRGQTRHPDERHASLRRQVEEAAAAIAPLWPLTGFISRSPLQGLEGLSFETAAGQARDLFGARAYLSDEDYRGYRREGRIRRRDLKQVLARCFPDLAGATPIRVGPEPVEPYRLLARAMEAGAAALDPGEAARRIVEADAHGLWPEEDALAERLLRHGAGLPMARTEALKSAWQAIVDNLPDPDSDTTVADAKTIVTAELETVGERFTLTQWCVRLTGEPVDVQLDNEVIKWCGAFLDQGQAVWSMPLRGRGLLEAWRSLAVYDRSLARQGVPGLAQLLDELPASPEEALEALLQRLGVPERHRTAYLRRQLATLPGWAGFIKWRESNPEGTWQQAHPADLVQYLVIRLSYELVLCEAAFQRHLELPAAVDALVAHFKAHPEDYLLRIARHDPTLPSALRAKIRHPKASAGYVLAYRGQVNSPRWRQLCTTAWPLLGLARASGWNAEDLRQAGSEEYRRLFELLARLSPTLRQELWQSAFEDHYQDALVRELAGRHPVAHTRKLRPRAQLALCIDVRSGPLRRHLEDLGEYETLGFAGFFGVPIRYRPLHDGQGRDLCPVLLTPNHSVREIPRSHQADTAERARSGAGHTALLKRVYHDLKGHLLTPYVFVEALGWVFGLPFVAKTAFARSYQRLKTTALRTVRPTVATEIPVDRLSEAAAQEMLVSQQRSAIRQALDDHFGARRERLPLEALEELRLTALTGRRPEGGTQAARRYGLDDPAETELIEGIATHYGVNAEQTRRDLAQLRRDGFDTDEQVALVESALRTMGLTHNVGRLVVLCAHGSSSENNPYESALDCGACGGEHGAPNARVFATMANRSAVREGLAARGLSIPEDTWFLAAEHDTTTDSVALLDLEDVPFTHRRDVERLAADLREAGARNAQERCERLPGAPRSPAPEQALHHVQHRSADWAQVLPEWGLTGNAAFIVGRRDLTDGIDLEGRAFLHSYDYAQDPEGRALEGIMTAPLVVAEWINLEYYFSSVDNAVFGSGTKVVHNVVGAFGIMQGNQSDLRMGLPHQSLYEGERRIHEPLRLLAVIEAPQERVVTLIRRHAVLQRFFDNGWVNLLVCDPQSGAFLRYERGGRWRAVGQGAQRAA